MGSSISSSLKKASTPSELKSSVDSIPRNQNSYTKEIRDLIIAKKNYQQLLYQKRLLFTEKANGVRYALAKIRADGQGGHIDDGTINIDYNDSLDYCLTPFMSRLMSYKMREV